MSLSNFYVKSSFLLFKYCDTESNGCLPATSTDMDWTVYKYKPTNILLRTSFDIKC